MCAPVRLCVLCLTTPPVLLSTPLRAQSPKAFVRGVVKGTSSLVSNTTSGFLGVAGRISKGMGGTVLYVLSQNQRFMQSRDKIAKVRGGRREGGEGEEVGVVRCRV